MVAGFTSRKADIEGVGCFTVPKPVWDLLQDIDTILDAVTAERDAAIAERAHYGDTMSAKLGQCENERDALRDTLQDWQVAAGTREAERDAEREDNKRLRALLTELTYTPDNASYNAP